MIDEAELRGDTIHGHPDLGSYTTLTQCLVRDQKRGKVPSQHEGDALPASI